MNQVDEFISGSTSSSTLDFLESRSQEYHKQSVHTILAAKPFHCLHTLIILLPRREVFGDVLAVFGLVVCWPVSDCLKHFSFASRCQFPNWCSSVFMHLNRFSVCQCTEIVTDNLKSIFLITGAFGFALTSNVLVKLTICFQ